MRARSQAGKVRIVVVMFDWDGVLLDSLQTGFNVYNKIFARMGTKQLTKDEFLGAQSPNWYEFYMKVGIPESLWKDTDKEWVRLYKEESPELHSDALGCITTLRKHGFRLGLVSNGSKERVEEELKRLRLTLYFDSTIFGVKREELKPSPFMLDRTLNVLGLSPDDAVYVGDSPADIQAAKNAGVRSIGIARGPIQAVRLQAERPDQIFGGLSQMTEFLLNNS
jgi:HAD superfamily hydrolase (TIGR01509 family)